MKNLPLFYCLFLGLTGCAGPLLNQNTIALGPSVGTLEEKQILTNLGRFVDNPWSIPGHVELANGQIQVTNQLGFALKYPHTSGLSGATLTKSATDEFDLTPAQTQDQESYSLSPVTDADDLRRLRALYHYSVCPSQLDTFKEEWQLADQTEPGVFGPPRASKTTPRVKTDPRIEQKAKDALAELQKKKDAKTAEDAKTKVDLYANQKFVLSEAQITSLNEALLKGELTTVAAVNTKVKLAGAKEAPKPASDGDTSRFEEVKKNLIIGPLGLGTDRWLYWRDDAGQISGFCPGVDYKIQYPANPDRLIRLGFFGGHEFWTDSPRKFSNLVLFVLGGIPNTTGVHILAAEGIGKSSRSLNCNGSGPSAFTCIPPKGT